MRWWAFANTPCAEVCGMLVPVGSVRGCVCSGCYCSWCMSHSKRSVERWASASLPSDHLWVASQVPCSSPWREQRSLVAWLGGRLARWLCAAYGSRCDSRVFVLSRGWEWLTDWGREWINFIPRITCLLWAQLFLRAGRSWLSLPVCG